MRGAIADHRAPARRVGLRAASRSTCRSRTRSSAALEVSADPDDGLLIAFDARALDADSPAASKCGCASPTPARIVQTSPVERRPPALPGRLEHLQRPQARGRLLRQRHGHAHRARELARRERARGRRNERREIGRSSGARPGPAPRSAAARPDRACSCARVPATARARDPPSTAAARPPGEGDREQRRERDEPFEHGRSTPAAAATAAPTAPFRRHPPARSAAKPESDGRSAPDIRPAAHPFSTEAVRMTPSGSPRAPRPRARDR